MIKNIYNDYESLDIAPRLIEWEIYESKEQLYCNNLISFDIETTSKFQALSKDGQKNWWESYNKENAELYVNYNSLCYCWSAAIGFSNNIYRYFGRTLESFKVFLSDIEKETPDTIKYIYVHNLKYEFQFLRNIFSGMKVFARETRTPIYFEWENFEFRCSYLLTNLSLANWAKTKNLTHQKMVGDLDYYIERTPYTKMSKEEINYSLEDSVIVVEGLQEYKNQYKYVKRIPLTQTGRVRREIQSLMLKEYKWHDKMYDAYCKDFIDYYNQTKVFWGGLTRANRLHAGRIKYNVASRDATSAYPWQMLSKQFPISDFKKTTNFAYYKDNDNFCYYLTVEFYNVKSKFWNSYIPTDKCISCKGVMADNGRIIEADYIKIMLLDVDYNIIKRSYDIDKEEILEMWTAIKGYLNPTFLRYVLHLFIDKTEYKGLDDKAELYMRQKEMLNSLYGMMVTKEFNNEITFEKNEWGVEHLTLESYNSKLEEILSKKYKLNYTFMMGAYTVAYQRESLWAFVEEFDELIVYMDTDSHKYIKTKDTEKWYNEYNCKVREEQEMIASRLDIDISQLRPLTPKGEMSSIGEYTIEKDYAEFITLGAKRYSYKYKGDSECHCTISGVNKSEGGKALKGDLNNFKDGFTFENEYCKKITLHYLDNQDSIVYNKGKADEYVSNYQYGIASEPSTYKVDMHSYKDTLLEVMQKVKEYNFKQLDAIKDGLIIEKNNKK